MPHGQRIFGLSPQADNLADEAGELFVLIVQEDLQKIIQDGFAFNEDVDPQADLPGSDDITFYPLQGFGGEGPFLMILTARSRGLMV
jgi:hypothetical protein